MKEKLAPIGSLLTSALLTFCCPLPLALAALGLGSLSVGTVIRPFRPYLTAFSLLLLVIGFWTVYRKPSATKNRVLIWIAASVFVLSNVPYAIALLRDPVPPVAADEPGTRRMVVHVDGLVWAPCCEGPAKEALAALPGVRRVWVNYARSEATLVVYEDAEIDDAVVTRALRAVNHSGHIKKP